MGNFRLGCRVIVAPLSNEDTQAIEIELAHRKRRDSRSRYFEVAISVAASAIVSAATVAWSLSATLASFREQLNDHTRRLLVVEGLVPTSAGDIASLKARQDGDDRARIELDARLQRIEQKLDVALERGRR